jgi:hypothetical protein
MDNDYLMAMLIDTVLADVNTKEKYEFPVVLNDAQTFMDRCVAILSADKVNYEITGVDATIQHKLEDFYELCLYINDEQLALRGMNPLRTDQNWYNLYRGWMGSLWLLYEVEGKIIPSIVASDPRGMTWEYGARGLKQFSYPARMDTQAAQEKYGKSLPGDKKYTDLKCVWTDTHELVYVASPQSVGVSGEPLKSKEHEFGICPGVISSVPTQPSTLINNEGYDTKLSRRGESIMAPNRQIYPMLNKLASILASIAQAGWKANTVLKSDNKEGFEKDPIGSGKIAQIGKEDSLELWPFRDLSSAMTYLTSILTSNKQKGGLSDINYGQIQFQVASLVVAQLKDDRDGIFVPRRQTNKIHYQQGFNIFRYMAKNGKFYPGDPQVINSDDAIAIDPKIFEKKFKISINYTSISPEENISNWTIAKQAEGMIPREEILRDIIHHADPQGAMEKLALQNAHDVVPGLREFDMAMAAAPGNLSEEKKQEIRTDLIMKYIDNILAQPAGQTMPSVPGMASQPKLQIGPSSPEKVSQKNLNQTGQMDAINARRSAGG